MKTRFLMVCVVLIGSVLIGCPSAPNSLNISHENWGVFGETALIPVKDFEPLGFVFTTTSFRIDSRGGITGNVFSYQDLLREAQKLGAHDIINVTIDRQTSFVGKGKSRVQVETWRGSALAVKYTDVVTNPGAKVNEARRYNLIGGGSIVTEPTHRGGLFKSSE